MFAMSTFFTEIYGPVALEGSARFTQLPDGRDRKREDLPADDDGDC